LLQQNRGCPNPGYKCGLQLNLIIMINQKRGLLSRVRIVLTALVMLTGIGTTLMAMKPADKMAAYTYGVVQSALTESEWTIVRNISDAEPDSYECSLTTPNRTCKIHSDALLSPNTGIAKDSPSINSSDPGTFQYFD
jgi:hypothetical protein